MFLIRVIGGLFRRLLIGGIRLLVSHPVSALIIMGLLGVVFFLAGAEGPTPAGSLVAQAASASPTVAPSTRLNRPAAAEEWLLGYRIFDARIVWDSMSDSMKADAQQKGTTMDALQKKLDGAKSAGNTMQKADYVGGYDTGNGRLISFYVVVVRDGSSGDVGFIPFTFTTGPDGKLLSVE